MSSLWDVLPVLVPSGPISFPETLTMEQVGQSYGFILYRTQIPSSMTASTATIKIPGLRDRGIVFVNQVRSEFFDTLMPVFAKSDVDYRNLRKGNCGIVLPVPQIAYSLISCHQLGPDFCETEIAPRSTFLTFRENWLFKLPATERNNKLIVTLVDWRDRCCLCFMVRFLCLRIHMHTVHVHIYVRSDLFEVFCRFARQLWFVLEEKQAQPLKLGPTWPWTYW